MCFPWRRALLLTLALSLPGLGGCGRRAEEKAAQAEATAPERTTYLTGGYFRIASGPIQPASAQRWRIEYESVATGRKVVWPELTDQGPIVLGKLVGFVATTGGTRAPRFFLALEGGPAVDATSPFLDQLIPGQVPRGLQPLRVWRIGETAMKFEFAVPGAAETDATNAVTVTVEDLTALVKKGRASGTRLDYQGTAYFRLAAR